MNELIGEAKKMEPDKIELPYSIQQHRVKANFLETALNIKNQEREFHPTLRCDVAIVGGGFSGAILAANLLRECDDGLALAIINKTHSLGKGIAYSTECATHLLNVRASDMSGWSHDRGHFVEWLKENASANVSPDQFMPRRLFGKYVESLLKQSVAERPNVRFLNVEDEVIHAELAEDGVKLRTGYNLQFFASRAVLAIGSSPSQEVLLMRGASPSFYRENAWISGTLSDTTGLRSVLLLGTGLTAIDQVLALKTAGFQGKIFMLSRHGLLPRAQTLFSKTYSTAWTLPLPGNIRSLFTAVRNQIEHATLSGFSWHDVLDSMRPESQRIWALLAPPEKRRFLRHVRHYWDIHRHRIAPDVQSALAELIGCGRVTILAGRLASYQELEGRPSVAFLDRKTNKMRTLHVDRIINCTGPGYGMHLFKSPLIKSLLDSGAARPDDVMMGVDVSENGALIDNSGMPSSVLFALGALSKGCFWETTAVPEIRTQASHIARHLLRAIALNTI